VDLEALAVGFLYNEGIIEAMDEVEDVRICEHGDNVNETHYFVLGARHNEGSGYTVFVESKNGSDPASQAASIQIEAAPGDTLHLRLRGDDTDYIFDCSTDGGANWKQVGDTFDARQLSVATSYDFIGVLVGVVARTE
jgi:beta-xylosidase